MATTSSEARLQRRHFRTRLPASLLHSRKTMSPRSHAPKSCHPQPDGDGVQGLVWKGASLDKLRAKPLSIVQSRYAALMLTHVFAVPSSLNGIYS